MPSQAMLNGKVALVTGAARRIGAAIATRLHADGANVAIHHRGSAAAAAALANKLNKLRVDSARTFHMDLADIASLPGLVNNVVGWHDRLDVLVNNASVFYPTRCSQERRDGRASRQHY